MAGNGKCMPPSNGSDIFCKPKIYDEVGSGISTASTLGNGTSELSGSVERLNGNALNGNGVHLNGNAVGRHSGRQNGNANGFSGNGTHLRRATPRQQHGEQYYLKLEQTLWAEKIQNAAKAVEHLFTWLFSKYIKIAAEYPLYLMGATLTITIVASVLGFKFSPLPSFGDPTLGFEARGNPLSATRLTWENLVRQVSYRKTDDVRYFQRARRRDKRFEHDAVGYSLFPEAFHKTYKDSPTTDDLISTAVSNIDSKSHVDTDNQRGRESNLNGEMHNESTRASSNESSEQILRNKTILVSPISNKTTNNSDSMGKNRNIVVAKPKNILVKPSNSNIKNNNLISASRFQRSEHKSLGNKGFPDPVCAQLDYYFAEKYLIRLIYAAPSQNHLLSHEGIVNFCKMGEVLLSLLRSTNITSYLLGSVKSTHPVWSIAASAACFSNKKSCGQLTVNDNLLFAKRVQQCRSYSAVLMRCYAVKRQAGQKEACSALPSYCKVRCFATLYKHILGKSFSIDPGDSSVPTMWPNMTTDVTESILIASPAYATMVLPALTFDAAAHELDNIHRENYLDIFGAIKSLESGMLPDILAKFPKTNKLWTKFSELTSARVRSDLTLKGVNLGAQSSFLRDSIRSDNSLGLLALAFVTCILVLYSGSLFFSIMVSLTLVGSVSLTYAIYHLLFQMDFFPFLNVFIVIVLLGIGADDALVLCHSWSAARVSSVSVKTSVARTARTAFWHCLSAMFVTSLTTAVSFYANMVSPIIALKCFGLFSGSVVIVNFLLILVWLAPSVAVYHLYLRPKWNAFTNYLPYQVLASFENASQAATNVSRAIFSVALPKFISLVAPVLVFIFSGAFIASIIIVLYSPGLKLPQKDVFNYYKPGHLFSWFDTYVGDHFWYPDRTKVSVKVALIWGIAPSRDDSHYSPFDSGSITPISAFSIDQISLQRINSFIKAFSRSPYVVSKRRRRRRYRKKYVKKIDRKNFNKTKTARRKIITNPLKRRENNHESKPNYNASATLLKVATAVHGTIPPVSAKPIASRSLELEPTWIDNFVQWSLDKPVCSSKDSPASSDNHPSMKKTKQMCCKLSDPKFKQSDMGSCLLHSTRTLFYSSTGQSLDEGFTGPIFDSNTHNTPGAPRVAAIVHQAKTNFVFTLHDRNLSDIQHKMENVVNTLSTRLTCPKPLIVYRPTDLMLWLDVQQSLLAAMPISFAVAFAVVTAATFLTTRSLLVSILSIITIIGIISITLSILTLAGWELNIIEAVVVVLAIGMSFDYTLHVAVAYLQVPKSSHSPSHSSNKSPDGSQEHVDTVAILNCRLARALGYIGEPIAGAALTTFTAGACLVGAQTNAYSQVGLFTIVVTMVSIIMALLCFPSALITVALAKEYLCCFQHHRSVEAMSPVEETVYDKSVEQCDCDAKQETNSNGTGRLSD